MRPGALLLAALPALLSASPAAANIVFYAVQSGSGAAAALPGGLASRDLYGVDFFRTEYGQYDLRRLTPFLLTFVGSGCTVDFANLHALAASSPALPATAGFPSAQFAAVVTNDAFAASGCVNFNKIAQQINGEPSIAAAVFSSIVASVDEAHIGTSYRLEAMADAADLGNGVAKLILAPQASVNAMHDYIALLPSQTLLLVNITQEIGDLNRLVRFDPGYKAFQAILGIYFSLGFLYTVYQFVLAIKQHQKLVFNIRFWVHCIGMVFCLLAILNIDGNFRTSTVETLYWVYSNVGFIAYNLVLFAWAQATRRIYITPNDPAPRSEYESENGTSIDQPSVSDVSTESSQAAFGLGKNKVADPAAAAAAKGDGPSAPESPPASKTSKRKLPSRLRVGKNLEIKKYVFNAQSHKIMAAIGAFNMLFFFIVCVVNVYGWFFRPVAAKAVLLIVLGIACFLQAAIFVYYGWKLMSAVGSSHINQEKRSLVMRLTTFLFATIGSFIVLGIVILLYSTNISDNSIKGYFGMRAAQASLFAILFGFMMYSIHINRSVNSTYTGTNGSTHGTSGMASSKMNMGGSFGAIDPSRPNDEPLSPKTPDGPNAGGSTVIAMGPVTPDGKRGPPRRKASNIEDMDLDVIEQLGTPGSRRKETLAELHQTSNLKLAADPIDEQAENQV